MLEANLKIIEELKLFVSLIKEQPEALSVLSTVKNAFIRTRKLPFERLVFLIAKLCKKTLSIEIDDFFEEISVASPCSVSAFVQGRMKLSPIFFLLWNQLLGHCFYHYYKDQVKRWRGYRLIAGDGSNISLVNTPILNSYFGGQSNQLGSFVQAKVFYCYDVLNEIVLFPQIQPYRVGEVRMAYNNAGNLESDMLMIYDRLYCSYKMIALHLWQEREIKFVIRGNESQLFVQEFIASEKQSVIKYIKPTPFAIKGLKECGYKIDKNTLLKVRMIRVNLESCVEVLVTNLWEEEGYNVTEFKELYFKRWGIETHIDHQKNILRLESFSGLTVQSVQQDFFATAFIANLHAILIKESQTIIDETLAHRMHPVKINKNKSYGKLRKYIVALFMNQKPREILLLLNTHFIRDPVPIRKGRSFKRRVKNKQYNSKHKNYMNYKPSF
jgi:hypothetical protein